MYHPSHEVVNLKKHQEEGCRVIRGNREVEVEAGRGLKGQDRKIEEGEDRKRGRRAKKKRIWRIGKDQRGEVETKRKREGR